MGFNVKSAFLALGLLALLGASAHAQATRTWVSGVGDDANPCNRTAPCKTFAGAISKTAASGEINVLDPGGYGALTITKAITVRSDHVAAGVLVSGTNGVIINAGATDKVYLVGLEFEGLGTGLNGVNILQAGAVTIESCEIRNFAQNGVNVAGPAGTKVLIDNSRILGNGGTAASPAGGGVDNVSGSVFITNSVVDGNAGFGVKAESSGATAISGDVITRNGAAITTASGGVVLSYGNNTVRGVGSPTSTIPLQ